MTRSTFPPPGSLWEFAASLEPPTWEEVPVEVRYSNAGLLKERWYRNTETGEVWRLVEPDYPFQGVWERVG